MTSFTPARPAPRRGAPPPDPTPVVDYAGGFEEMHAGLRPRFKELLLSECEPARTVALDVGCGAGRVAFFLASHVKHVIGVDLDAKSIEAARAKAKSIGLGSKAEFVAGDVEKTPWSRIRQEGFDLAATNLCFSEQTIARAGAALSHGGAFVFTSFGPEQLIEVGGSSFALSEGAIRHAADQAGLRVEALEADAQRVRFKSVQEAREALGEERVGKMLADGRWDRLAENFGNGKRTLTESRWIGVLRR